MQKRHNSSIAVIGGGIGGVCTAELLSKEGFKVNLFEKSSTIGGCAGSFKRNGFRFNIGATTIAGLLPDYPVRKILSTLSLQHGIELKDPGLIVFTEKAKIKRYLGLHESIEEINRVFPHKSNERFWKTVYWTTKSVLCHEYYCNFSSKVDELKTLWNIRNLIFKKFWHYLLPAQKGLKIFFGRIDKTYYDFMNSHVKIVAQSTIDKVNLLTLLLSLGYPFTAIGYPAQGMGGLIEDMMRRAQYNLKSEVMKIKKVTDGYLVKGNFGEERFDNIVVAYPIFENIETLENGVLKDYFLRYKDILSDNSAIVVYGVLKGFIPENSFNLIINSTSLPFTTSNYVFLSFDDPTTSHNGHQYITFTASTHTSTNFWVNLTRDDYNKRKRLIEDSIIKIIKRFINIEEKHIVQYFSATPETFYRYLGRRSVGGVPVEMKNPIWKIPSNFTPFKGLYLIGDSFFSYQGWIGISMGVWNLINRFVVKG